MWNPIGPSYSQQESFRIVLMCVHVRNICNPALWNREDILNIPIIVFIKKYNASYKYPIVVIISSSVQVIALEWLVRTKGQSAELPRAIKYTQFTLKLRPVKLLFLSFGHLSYYLFGKPNGLG